MHVYEQIQHALNIQFTSDEYHVYKQFVHKRYRCCPSKEHALHVMTLSTKMRMPLYFWNFSDPLDHGKICENSIICEKWSQKVGPVQFSKRLFPLSKCKKKTVLLQIQVLPAPLCPTSVITCKARHFQTIRIETMFYYKLNKVMAQFSFLFLAKKLKM